MPHRRRKVILSAIAEMMTMVDTEEMREERESYVALDVVKCVQCGKGCFLKRGEAFKCVCGSTVCKLPLEGCRSY